jgi:hypothetical protein
MTVTYAEGARRREAPAAVRCPEPDPAEVTREGGQPLDGGVRQRMERAYGHDFGSVRVHAGERAATAARDSDALAFSTGSDVVFGAGQYRPGTPSGERLIAHELAHVVQRGGGGGTAGVPALEVDADRAAAAVVAGHAPAVRHRAAAGPPLRQGAAAAPAVAPPEPAPLEPVVPKAHAGPYGNVDAVYDRRIAWLTVVMKVKFCQDDSIQRWPSRARFDQFVREFAETVSRRWSFRHFLVPTGDPAGEPPRVAVRMQVQPVDTDWHAIANVRYSDDYQQSSANTVGADLDQADTEDRGFLIPQTPAQHEFGHMLGLDHIAAGKVPPKSDEEYGRNREERADVMGEGSYVSPRDYGIFARILGDVTQRPWQVQQASYMPTGTTNEKIGGVVGALAGGGLGAVLGAAVGSLFGPLGTAIGGGLGALVGMAAGWFGGRAIGAHTPRTPL